MVGSRLGGVRVVMLGVVLAMGAATASAGGATVLTVGGAGGPLVAALAERYEVRPLATPVGGPLDGSLTTAAAVVIDLGRADDDELARSEAVADIARRAGVPLIVLDADATRLARLVGLGVDGEVVVVRRGGDGRPELRAMAAIDLAGGEHGGPAAVRDLADRIGQLLDEAEGSAGASGSPHRINYEAWIVGIETESWTPSGNPGGSDQVAVINIYYQVELVANSELNEFPNQKYLKVKLKGTGMNPGELPDQAAQDADRERGWFQDRLEVEIAPDSVPAGLGLMAAAPGTTDTYSTYSESTGWEVGVDSSGAFGLTYSSSQTSTSTFQNFRVDYTGPGATARWVYRMSSTGGSPQYPYSGPADLVYQGPFSGCPLLQTCLRPVNEFAVSTIGLAAEAVWQAPLDFDDTVEFHLGHHQRLSFIRYDHTECNLLTCQDHYQWFQDTSGRDHTLAVDFSSVLPYGPDDDADGIPNWYEGSLNSDGTPPADYQDTDSDDDGLFDFDEWIDDPDDDGKPNYRDPDSDNDGFLDAQEVVAGTDPYSAFSRPDITTAALQIGRASADGAGATIPLGPGLSDPVVLAGPPTRHDGEPGVVRLSSIGPAGFTAAFQEWSYLDGDHGSEDFSFLATEPGRYGTSWGGIWEAGRFTVTGTDSWQHVAFSAPMNAPPVVLVTPQTDTSGQAVVARVRNVDENGFDVALFTEQAAAPLGSTETVAYLAVDSARGSDVIPDGGRDLPTLVQRLDGDDQPAAALSSFLVMQEETSADPETDHGLEALGVLAVGPELFAQDQQASDLDPAALRLDRPEYGGALEIGVVRGVTHDLSLFVPYAKSYTAPIVIAYSTRPGDDDAGEVRVSPVVRTPSLTRYWRDGGFMIHFQPFLPPDWAPGVCDAVDDSPRDIRYLVADSGAGTVGGLSFETGSIYSDKRVADGDWDGVFFQNGFASTPSTFSSLQTEKCGSILGAEISSPSPTGLSLSTDGQDDYCAYCSLVWDPEEDWNEIGWLAFQPGQGVTVDGRLVQVGPDGFQITYGQAPPEPPTARFRWEPVQPAPGQPVQFIDTSTGNPTQWSWSFGDGGSDSAQNPVHTFDAPGTYTVFQAVTSNLGLDTTTSAVVVGAGGGATIFEDGFESGDLSAWSAHP